MTKDTFHNYAQDETGKSYQIHGNYPNREVRYKAAAEFIMETCRKRKIDPDTITVVDIAAGFTGFDYCLRTKYDFKGRYIPIDKAIDGTELESWEPYRKVHFFVALEIIEHLHDWETLVEKMMKNSTMGTVVSTPNPEICDVFGMAEDHVRQVYAQELNDLGFDVLYRMFYQGSYNREGKEKEPDALFAVWENRES